MARNKDELTAGYLIAMTYALNSRSRTRQTMPDQTDARSLESREAHDAPGHFRSQEYDWLRRDSTAER